jgi:purine-nucleoside phosphorylase
VTGRFGISAARVAAAAIKTRVSQAPRVAIVLGSGLGGIAKAIESPTRVPYREIPGFPDVAVAGHAGELICGTLSGVPVAALSGRFHMYEGHDEALAAFPARVVRALGAETLIVSNAAGGLKKTLKPGTLVLITDHINLMGRNPLVGPVVEGDTRFPDMSDAYDAKLRALAKSVATKLKVKLAEGVYVGLLGPTYETKAEVRMLAKLGGDVVGMSTVPEVIVAKAIGLKVLGFSCVTNLASGLSKDPITHAEVLETTARVAVTMEKLVRGIVAKL